MRNVADKRCRGNQNTDFVFSKVLMKIVPLRDNVGKLRIAGRATDENITRSLHTACWITNFTNTHLEYLILTAFYYNNGCKKAPQHYVICTFLFFNPTDKQTWGTLLYITLNKYMWKITYIFGLKLTTRELDLLLWAKYTRVKGDRRGEGVGYVRPPINTWCVQVLRYPNFCLGNGSR
jgi:hypothetical protein